jgi:hypothetical protein
VRGELEGIRGYERKNEDRESVLDMLGEKPSGVRTCGW